MSRTMAVDAEPAYFKGFRVVVMVRVKHIEASRADRAMSWAAEIALVNGGIDCEVSSSLKGIGAAGRMMVSKTPGHGHRHALPAPLTYLAPNVRAHEHHTNGPKTPSSMDHLRHRKPSIDTWVKRYPKVIH